MRIESEHNGEDSLFVGFENLDYFVVCDVCGERIDAERLGIATWGRPGVATRSMDEGITQEGDVAFVHKGRCDDKRRDLSWMDADRFFSVLLRSMGRDEVDRKIHQPRNQD